MLRGFAAMTRPTRYSLLAPCLVTTLAAKLEFLSLWPLVGAPTLPSASAAILPAADCSAERTCSERRYLAQNLPKVEDARILVEDGYVFYLIAENADAGEAAFHAYVEAQA